MLQPKLTKVETISPLKLRLFYETGEVKLFDVAPYATGPWYGQLKDESYFNAVQLLPGGVATRAQLAVILQRLTTQAMG